MLSVRTSSIPGERCLREEAGLAAARRAWAARARRGGHYATVEGFAAGLTASSSTWGASEGRCQTLEEHMTRARGSSKGEGKKAKGSTKTPRGHGAAPHAAHSSISPPSSSHVQSNLAQCFMNFVTRLRSPAPRQHCPLPRRGRADGRQRRRRTFCPPRTAGSWAYEIKPYSKSAKNHTQRVPLQLQPGDLSPP